MSVSFILCRSFTAIVFLRSLACVSPSLNRGLYFVFLTKRVRFSLSHIYTRCACVCVRERMAKRRRRPICLCVCEFDVRIRHLTCNLVRMMANRMGAETIVSPTRYISLFYFSSFIFHIYTYIYTFIFRCIREMRFLRVYVCVRVLPISSPFNVRSPLHLHLLFFRFSSSPQSA